MELFQPGQRLWIKIRQEIITMKTRWISLFVLLALAVTGCAPSQIAAAESTDLPSIDPTRESLSTLIPAQPTQGDKTQMNPFLPTPPASVWKD